MFITKQDNDPVVIILRRNHWKRDDALNIRIAEYFADKPFSVLWETPPKKILYNLFNSENTSKFIPAIIKKINRKTEHIFYPFHWKYIADKYIQKTDSLQQRLKKIDLLITQKCNNKNIIIIARSSGCIVSTRLSQTNNAIKKIVCLGYPFKHPQEKDNSIRYVHLQNLTKPVLIIQGKNDLYGGEEIIEKYTFSKTIKFHFVNTNHDFNTSNDEWNKICEQITSFILS